jgi:hypothetical protein
MRKKDNEVCFRVRCDDMQPATALPTFRTTHRVHLQDIIAPNPVGNR